jgi:hypothetical protein
MSVVKSKRLSKKQPLQVITKANNLTTHTIRICSNENNFPKRYRWCITSKIVDAAVEIARNATIANSINADSDREMYSLRKKYQTIALANTYSLLTLIDIAYNTFSLEGDKVDYWVGLVEEVQNLLRNWKRSDEQRYKG